MARPSSLILVVVAACSGSGRPDGACTSDLCVRPDTGMVDVPVDVAPDLPPDGPVVLPCPGMPDADRDGIPDIVEGAGDRDGDGLPDAMDPDADGDGRGDALEADAGRAFDCTRGLPIDSDGDATPDYLDTDSDDNGLPDRQDFVGPGAAPPAGWPAEPNDQDHDGRADYVDPDDDDDGIPDRAEILPGDPTLPADTDADGLPDHRDDDADGDTLRDRVEGPSDRDHDGTANFRDLDSDGDRVPDRDEAGDGDPATPPVDCAHELSLMTLDPLHPEPDGVPDYLDNDADNDGLGDGEEAVAMTQRCGPDTDGDRALDSLEVACCRVGRREGCATSAMVVIPPADTYVLLPDGGAASLRELEFPIGGVTAMDVFVLADTTGSMAGVIATVQGSIATPSTGLFDRLRAVVPDTWLGVGHFDDFALTPFGYGTDRPVWPNCPGPPGTMGCADNWGIVVQPPARAMDVQATAAALRSSGGGDGSEAQVEALYQVLTGEGLFDRSRPDACAGVTGADPCWVPPADCPAGRFGLACFRPTAQSVVVQYSDAPFHNGAIDEVPAGTGFHDPYRGISPPPHTMDDLVAAYNRTSARVVSFNAGNWGRCVGVPRQTNHVTYSPCFDFRILAEGTGSVDATGVPAIFDLPLPVTATGFISASVAGLTMLAGIPGNVSTMVVDDPANPAGLAASRFITGRTPSCQVPPVNDRCWTEPLGTMHETAVARTDAMTFYRVARGTRLRFTLTLANRGTHPGDAAGMSVFHATVQAPPSPERREVYAVVPVRPLP